MKMNPVVVYRFDSNAERKLFPLFEKTDLETYVDGLLASPHFGERMAIEWLDAVRYADSVGYHGDQLIEVSAYRDWVINAFNANMPFDQFTIEQIAGDLLPDATLQQKVAAVFNRLGQTSEEGGIQNAEYLAKYQAERVRTTTTTWMGATLACAECHDHKFDPYSTKDFYQFAAFFADILEKGAWTGDGSFQEDIKPYEAQGYEYFDLSKHHHILRKEGLFAKSCGVQNGCGRGFGRFVAT